MKKINLIVSAFLMSVSVTANANIIVPEIDGQAWIELSSEDQTAYFLNPGYGGQLFDAEYLLYNYDKNTNILNIALQTGFNINTNTINYGSKDYWGGDLALSFDGATEGDSSTFEYAIDFGEVTKGYDGQATGNNKDTDSKDQLGLYKDVTWEADSIIHFTDSNPFAMASGITPSGISFSQVGNSSGNNAGDISYYRSFSLDLGSIDVTELSASWTMSCGNDGIYGTAEIPPTSVPEPSSIALFSTGLIGLLGGLFVRRKRKPTTISD